MAGTVSNLLGVGGTNYQASNYANQPLQNLGTPVVGALKAPVKQTSLATPTMSNVSAQYPAATSGVKGLITPTPSTSYAQPATQQNNAVQSSTPSLVHPKQGLQTQGLTGGPAIPNAVNQYENPGNSLYGQIATGLANTAQTGSPQAQQAIGATQTAAQGAVDQYAPQEKQAFDQAQQYNKQLQLIQKQQP